jgi:hypothetical protein
MAAHRPSRGVRTTVRQPPDAPWAPARDLAASVAPVAASPLTGTGGRRSPPRRRHRACRTDHHDQYQSRSHASPGKNTENGPDRVRLVAGAARPLTRQGPGGRDRNCPSTCPVLASLMTPTCRATRGQRFDAPAKEPSRAAQATHCGAFPGEGHRLHGAADEGVRPNRHHVLSSAHPRACTVHRCLQGLSGIRVESATNTHSVRICHHTAPDRRAQK